MYEDRSFLLIVDDEQDFLYSARKHFERRNFHVETAEDGIAALEKFDSNAGIDLVITDIRMPRMGGEELIGHLRKRRPFLPILGVTGQPDLLDKLAFLDRGAYYFFDKPVERWEPVDRLVDNAIRLHHQEEELHRKRREEQEIAKMLRAFLRRSPIRHRAPSPERRFEVEVFAAALDAAGPSGDYVEWFERDGDELLFCAGDASGHEDLFRRLHHGPPPYVMTGTGLASTRDSRPPRPDGSVCREGRLHGLLRRGELPRPVHSLRPQVVAHRPVAQDIHECRGQ